MGTFCLVFVLQLKDVTRCSAGIKIKLETLMPLDQLRSPSHRIGKLDAIVSFDLTVYTPT